MRPPFPSSHAAPAVTAQPGPAVRAGGSTTTRPRWGHSPPRRGWVPGPSDVRICGVFASHGWTACGSAAATAPGSCCPTSLVGVSAIVEPTGVDVTVIDRTAQITTPAPTTPWCPTKHRPVSGWPLGGAPS